MLLTIAEIAYFSLIHYFIQFNVAPIKNQFQFGSIATGSEES